MNKLRRIRSTLMKFSTLLTVLPISAVFFCAAASAAIDGTDSVEMTFQAELTNTTCTAQITDAQGTPTNTINYGEVYKSEIAAKSRVVPFKIKFSACSGVDYVNFDTNPGAGGTCSGGTSGNAYTAATADGSDSNAAFELWLYGLDEGVQLNCGSPFSLMNMSVRGSYAEYDIDSRLVLASGKSVSDVTNGDVSAPVTFVLTYQ
ncbi:fimbrial protein [Salmonella enterica subsp. salamae]|nr:fimbrial protein [Salmonella enterica subsp. salamae]EED7471700.1 fimbrial protein [Salmonella enterica subsp. salamae]